MSAREFDRIAAWFFDSRLRGAAFCVALCVMAVGLMGWAVNAGNTGQDDYSYVACYMPVPGSDDLTAKPAGARVAAGVCNGSGGLHVASDWSPDYLVPWALVALAAFLLPMANAGLLLARRGAGSVGPWVTRVLDGRDRMRRAESKLAERDLRIARLEAESARRERALGRGTTWLEEA